jgi:hypothetical protein
VDGVGIYCFVCDLELHAAWLGVAEVAGVCCVEHYPLEEEAGDHDIVFADGIPVRGELSPETFPFPEIEDLCVKDFSTMLRNEVFKHPWKFGVYMP